MYITLNIIGITQGCNKIGYDFENELKNLYQIPMRESELIPEYIWVNMCPFVCLFVHLFVRPHGNHCGRTNKEILVSILENFEFILKVITNFVTTLCNSPDI